MPFIKRLLNYIPHNCIILISIYYIMYHQIKIMNLIKYNILSKY